MFGEVFLKELAGFWRYEAVEVELLDLLSIFLGQSLLVIDRFEMIHDAIKQSICFEPIQWFPPRWTGRDPFRRRADQASISPAGRGCWCGFPSKQMHGRCQGGWIRLYIWNDDGFG
jgi:hypothetical protein